MNRNRGKDGTWGYAEDLQAGLLTVEEAGEALTEGAYMLRGFYDEKQAKACRDGVPMIDIDPARFPSTRGPRDV